VANLVIVVEQIDSNANKNHLGSKRGLCPEIDKIRGIHPKLSVKGDSQSQVAAKVVHIPLIFGLYTNKMIQLFMDCLHNLRIWPVKNMIAEKKRRNQSRL
jgi:hypothetical protein